MKSIFKEVTENAKVRPDAFLIESMAWLTLGCLIAFVTGSSIYLARIFVPCIPGMMKEGYNIWPTVFVGALLLTFTLSAIYMGFGGKYSLSHIMDEIGFTYGAKVVAHVAIIFALALVCKVGYDMMYLDIASRIGIDAWGVRSLISNIVLDYGIIWVLAFSVSALSNND